MSVPTFIASVGSEPTPVLRLVVRVLNKRKTFDQGLAALFTGTEISCMRQEEAATVIENALTGGFCTLEKAQNVLDWARAEVATPGISKKHRKAKGGTTPATAEEEVEAEVAAAEALPELTTEEIEAMPEYKTWMGRVAEVGGYTKRIEEIAQALGEAGKEIAAASVSGVGLTEAVAKLNNLQAKQADLENAKAKQAEFAKEGEAVFEAAKVELAKSKVLEASYASAAMALAGDPDAGYRAPVALKEEVGIALSLGYHILLVGPAGTGKSSLVKDITKDGGKRLIRLNLNGQTGPDDLIGHYIAKEGATHWIEGALPKAMKEGLPILLDEIDFAVPEILSLLHPVLEPGGTLVLKEHDGEEVVAQEGFRIFATANSLGIHDDSGVYTGTQAMNHAFLSRWSGFFVEYPTETEETQAIRNHGIPKPIAEAAAKVASTVRSLIKAKTLNGAWGVRHTLDFARFSVALKGDVKRSFDMASRLKFSKAEAAAAWEAVQRVVGGKIA